MHSDNRHAKALSLGSTLLDAPSTSRRLVCQENSLEEKREEPVTRHPPREFPVPHYHIVLRLFDASRRQALDKLNYLVPTPLVRRFWTVDPQLDSWVQVPYPVCTVQSLTTFNILLFPSNFALYFTSLFVIHSFRSASKPHSLKLFAMRSTLIASAFAAPRPQDIEFDLVDAAPHAEIYTPPTNVTVDTVSIQPASAASALASAAVSNIASTVDPTQKRDILEVADAVSQDEA
jgi:hypothetical protein